MDFLGQLDWSAIVGVVALALVGFLGKLHQNLGKALEKLTDAVASESASGASITGDEKTEIVKALFGKG